MQSAHGIMFHHFHDGKEFPKVQGSISSENLDDIISYSKKRYNVIPAYEFLEKSNSNSLTEKLSS